MKDFAERMQRLGTESAFEVLAKAKALESQGREIIHLEIGEPDFDTPSNIKEKAVWSLNKGYTHYTPSAGMHNARASVAKYLSETRKIKINPEEVIIAPGGKPLIFLSILAFIEKDDEVLYPNPTYPAYESAINFVGGKAVAIPLLEEKNFCFDAKDLEKNITPRTKMIILNSPGNPTGGVLTLEDLEEVARLSKKYNLLVFSDEIYSRVIYDGEHHSIISLPGMKERTILLDGFSKTYAMTGWRMGYAAAPLKIIEGLTKLILNSVSCTNTFVQLAGIEALEGNQDEVNKMIKEFKKRRNFIVEGLNNIPGITCKLPQGAFYVFPNIKALGKNCKLVADYLLEEAGVAVLSGTAFGRYGEGYLRFSYANSIENIAKALQKIEKNLKKMLAKV